MRFRQVMTIFAISLGICIALRSFQIIFTLEKDTGFIKSEYSGINIAIMVIIFIAVVLSIVFATRVKAPENKSKKKNFPMSVCCWAGAIAVFSEFLSMMGSGNINVWYNTLFCVAAVALSGFFVAFAINNVCSFQMPEILFALPVIYGTIKLMLVFISFSALAFITDNILVLFSYSSILLYFLKLAKLENGIEKEKGEKTILSNAVATMLICGITAVPSLITAPFIESAVKRTDTVQFVIILIFFLFVLCDTYARFSSENAKSKKDGLAE